MPFIVTENCIKCKYTDCVEVCPVDCFYEAQEFLVINPDECIDCALCVPECPVDAIVADDEISDDQKIFIDINYQLSLKLPNINSVKAAPVDANSWVGVANKRIHAIEIVEMKNRLMKPRR